ALLWGNLGIVLKDGGQDAPAERALQEALKIGRKLLADQPADDRAARHQATYLHQLASLRMSLGRFPEAKAPCAEGLTLAGKLHRRQPDAVGPRITLGWAQSTRSNLALHFRRFDEVAESAAAARDLFGRLAKEHPDLREAQKGLGSALLNLGHAHRDSKPEV